MPNYPQYDLTHQYISESYPRVLQIVSGNIVLDGTGSNVYLTASYAETASYISIFDTDSFILSSQTSSMSVLSASYASNGGSGGTTNHAALSNLDYTNANHTGFAGVNVINNFTQNQIITGSLMIEGNLYATQKSFYINDKDNVGKHLVYGALEGPQNDVFFRGRIVSDKTTIKIDLPIEWKWLVNEDTITVQLTQRSFTQNLMVMSVKDNTVKVTNTTKSKKSKSELDFDFLIIGERKDIDKLKNRV